MIPGYNPFQGGDAMAGSLESLIRSGNGPGSQQTPQRDPWQPWTQQHPKPQFGGQDYEVMALLEKWMGQGLDPSVAASVMGGLQSDLSAQQGAWQGRHQAFNDKRDALAQMMPQVEQDAVTQMQAGVPQAAVQAGYSGYHGPTGNKLESLISNVYGSGGGATAGTPLTQEDVTGLVQTAQQAVLEQQKSRALVGSTPSAGGAAYTPQTAAQSVQAADAAPTTLHDLRMQAMTKARLAGYSEATVQQIYDILGQAFIGSGGDPGSAPATMQQMQTATAMAAPSPGAPSPADTAAATGGSDPATLMSLVDQWKTPQKYGYLPWAEGLTHPTVGLGTGLNQDTGGYLDKLIHPQAHGYESWAAGLNPFG